MVELIDASGNTVSEYTYNAWGNITSILNASGNEIVNNTNGTAIAFWNPLTYRGYIWDRESKLYYLESRYYDPVLKRFINADTLASTGQGFIGTNMFAYCNNNPAMYSDSGGMRPIWEDGHNGMYTDSGTGTIFFIHCFNYIGG